MMKDQVHATSTPAASATVTDRYQRIMLLLMSLAAAATAGALASTAVLANPLFLDVAVSTGLATGVLLDLILVHRRRLEQLRPAHGAGTQTETPEALQALSPPDLAVPRPSRRTQLLPVKRRPGFATGVAGLTAIGLIALQPIGDVPARPRALWALLIAAAWTGAAGLGGAVVRYLGNLDLETVPEAPALCRGARVVWWLLVAATTSMGLVWIPLWSAVQTLHWLAMALNVGVAYRLMRGGTDPAQVPLDIGILTMLGGRLNIVSSVLDAGERQLGVDLRSTWALTIIRRGVEPLVIALAFVGWLSTSMTVVGVEEQGLVERFGVPLSGAALAPGLHAHWPWPIDRVYRLPVSRVHTLEIGHEGQEAEGPEDVLWAVQHAPVEFTLLLGDGRDLITIDAGVQFRIRDARAWRYNCQNPVEALSALGYRAVTRSTVNRTLSEALSENVSTLTSHMRDMIQQDADALGLGVEILGFTVGGMHPPVPVATDYQAVISAELRKKTAVVDAQAFRITTLSEAERAVLLGHNAARGAGAQALGTAAGEAWSFRTLESQFRVAPDEYFFRRRLETLEYGLAERNVTVVDGRIERDGGELWIVR
jgi:regulator of protease activity HflC (stomatin/prohibitin superfamily)